MHPYTGYIVETFATLLAVCVVAVVVLWGARRLGVGRATGAIELYGHLALDGRRAIYLVKVGTQVFVVGVGDGVFAKLGELAASEIEGPASTRNARFAEVLARLPTKQNLAGPSGDARGEGE